MRLTGLGAALLALTLAGAAAADTGSGPYAPLGPGALEPNAPALSTFGDDVIRVRAYPTFTGTWMVELHGKPDGSAEGEAVFFGHFQRATRAWPRIGSVRLTIWPDDWPKLTAQVDALLAEGQVPPPKSKPRTDGVIEICVSSDGTSHQIERRRGGRDRWMTTAPLSLDCGGLDPSEAIAQLVFAAAAVHLCEAMQGLTPCRPGGPAPNDALAEYRERQGLSAAGVAPGR